MKVKVFHILCQVLIAGCGTILAVANAENLLLITVGVLMAAGALFSYICNEIELKNKEREVIAKEIKENEDKKLRYYTNVFNDLKTCLQKQIDLFTQIFKACSDKRPERIQQDISEFFNTNFYNTISRLDYLQKAPIFYLNGPKDKEASWFEYIEQEYLIFEAKLENAKKVLQVANLKDDVVLKLIDTILMLGNPYKQAVKISRLKGEMKTVLMAAFFLKNGLYNRKSWLELYVASVVIIAYAYNGICDKKIKINPQIWEEDYSPRVGSSIKKKEYYRVEEKNGNKYLEEVK